MGEETVRLDGNTLVLAGGVRVRFIRTLRLPETGTHALPPGIGDFPVRRVADYADTVPDEWAKRGGVMLPMYLREAMWLSFSAQEPAALQIGVGKVCAVSGKPWSDRLGRDPQNYVVLPRQPWLDGINSGAGTIRQFVAVPLGLGATVEGQVTGEEVWGGIQLQHFGLNEIELAQWRKAQRAREAGRGDGPQTLGSPFDGGYGEKPPPWAGGYAGGSGGYGAPPPGGPPPAPGGGYGGPAPQWGDPAGNTGSFGAYPAPPAQGAGYGSAPPPPGSAPGAPPARSAAGKSAKAMGLGVGGTMHQEIYADDRALESWATTRSGRVFVHLVTPPDWQRITGEAPPPSPVNRQAYTEAGLPWFDYFDSDATDLAPVTELSTVAPVGEWLGADHEPWQDPVPGQVHHLGDPKGKPVTDGDW
ncbi:hypothetical protein [Nocardia sp. NPDC057668]|uniref:hypothetical protein n=1 Tax=Nocardia sp. NPDC057668 TaxID=3346202 RepID=UPI003670BF12